MREIKEAILIGATFGMCIRSSYGYVVMGVLAAVYLWRSK